MTFLQHWKFSRSSDGFSQQHFCQENVGDKLRIWKTLIFFFFRERGIWGGKESPGELWGTWVMAASFLDQHLLNLSVPM